MTDCTVAAPVRATKPPARQKAAPSPFPAKPPLIEGDKLALEAAEVLVGMVSHIVSVEHELTRTLKPLSRADQLLELLLHADEHDRDPCDPAEGDVLNHLACIASNLEDALCDIQKADLPNYAPSEHAVFTAVIECAYNFAERLFRAYGGLPGTLEDLRALSTSAGAKPFRDRPQPPIRRLLPPDEALHTQLKIGATIAGLLVYNFGGDSDFDDPAKAPGLQGMVFGLQDATRTAHALATAHGCPQAQQIRTAAALAEHTAMLSGAELHAGDHGFRLGDEFLCDVFWSIERILEDAAHEVAL